MNPEIEELKKEIADLKRRLDESPAYFGKRFTNALASPNFVSGVSGWRIEDNGNVEFGDGTYRGIFKLIQSGVIRLVVQEDGIELYNPSGTLIGSLFADTDDRIHILIGVAGAYTFDIDALLPPTAGSTALGSSGVKWSDINTDLINGNTPLAGTKVYYVSDSSGGAVTRKLTFDDGILTSET